MLTLKWIGKDKGKYHHRDVPYKVLDGSVFIRLDDNDIGTLIPRNITRF